MFPLISSCGFLSVYLFLTVFEKGKLGSASTLDCDRIGAVLQDAQSISQGTRTPLGKVSNFIFLFPFQNFSL